MNTSTRNADKASASPKEAYLTFTKPAHPLIIKGMVMSAFSTLFGLVPYFIAIAIARMALTDMLPDRMTLAFMVIVAVICAAMNRVLYGGGTAVCHRADALFRVNARTILLEHFSKLPLGWFSERSSSEVKQVISDDVLGMHQSVGHAPSEIVHAVLTPLVPFIYLVGIDWRMSLGLLVYLVLLVAIAMIFMMRDYAELSDKYQEANVELSAATVEMTDGIEVVKTFSGMKNATGRFQTAVDTYTDIVYRWTKLTAGPFSLMTSLISPGVVLSLFALASFILIANGWSDFATCMPFLVLGPNIPVGLITVGTSAGFLRIARQSLEHMMSILAEKPLEEPGTPQDLADRDPDVSFAAVDFSYGKDLPLVLEDISAHLEPGTVTALVGDSGSGKTTFARLIPRFWDPVSGSVSLAGIDLRKARSGDVLAKTAIVFQESMLLSLSVRDNIRLARPEATDEEVERAARMAQIHDRICELPDGYDTILGSQDADLSGGEAQRIAIARAIIQDAPILILDEATAHADPENETAIQTALANLARGRTTVVIAHRLNTIAHANRIIVLEKGHIVEVGSHEELLDKNGRYAALWSTQHIGVSKKEVIG